jgi:hypothetical protein
VKVRDDATRFSELFSASSSYALQIPGNHLKNSIPKLDLSSLIPFSNWLTPHLGHKRRYDTVLFVLPLNLKSLPKAEPCDREMTSEVIWAEPREIVHRSHSGFLF